LTSPAIIWSIVRFGFQFKKLSELVQCSVIRFRFFGWSRQIEILGKSFRRPGILTEIVHNRIASDFENLVVSRIIDSAAAPQSSCCLPNLARLCRLRTVALVYWYCYREGISDSDLLLSSFRLESLSSPTAKP
jgi:hypothetical protein